METHDHELYARFDRYLAGKLAEAELLQLESEIEENAAIKAEFEGFLKTKHLAIQAGTLHEKESLHEISTKAHQQRQRSTRTRNLWMGGGLLAAAIALLIAVVMLVDFDGSADPAQLFAENFSLPDTPAPLGTVTDSLMAAAHKTFERQAYEAAIALYEQVPADSLSALQQSEKALFTGLSYLKLGNPGQARDHFQEMGQLTEQGDWYTALSWLTVPVDREKAQKAFQRIADREGHHYQEKAKEILEELGE